MKIIFQPQKPSRFRKARSISLLVGGLLAAGYVGVNHERVSERVLKAKDYVVSAAYNQFPEVLLPRQEHFYR